MQLTFVAASVSIKSGPCCVHTIMQSLMVSFTISFIASHVCPLRRQEHGSLSATSRNLNLKISRSVFLSSLQRRVSLQMPRNRSLVHLNERKRSRICQHHSAPSASSNRILTNEFVLTSLEKFGIQVASVDTASKLNCEEAGQQLSRLFTEDFWKHLRKLRGLREKSGNYEDAWKYHLGTGDL